MINHIFSVLLLATLAMGVPLQDKKFTVFSNMTKGVERCKASHPDFNPDNYVKFEGFVSLTSNMHLYRFNSKAFIFQHWFEIFKS